MSIAEPSFVGSDEEDRVYQAVSRSAVAAFVTGLLGILGFWFIPLLLLPVVGLILALISFREMRLYPEELTGKAIARLGLAVSVLTLAIAPALHIYTYMTEVPEGYQRLSFSQLKSPYLDVDAPPPTALELDGKPVFLKGYIHPTSIVSSSARRFILVPDMGTCCFGGQPKLTDMVEVTLNGNDFARYGMRQVKLAGTLHVDSQLKPIQDLQGVYYQLNADIYRQ